MCLCVCVCVYVRLHCFSLMYRAFAQCIPVTIKKARSLNGPLTAQCTENEVASGCLFQVAKVESGKVRSSAVSVSHALHAKRACVSKVPQWWIRQRGRRRSFAKEET